VSREEASFLAKVRGVVHVGANSGQERYDYFTRGLSVIWVEPIEEVFDQLLLNIKDYQNQRPLCALLSDQDDVEYQFHISNNEGMSSSIFQFGEHRDIWPTVDFLSSRSLRSVRLDTLFRREGLSADYYSALVMDVQGAELLVLKGAGRLLSQFRFVKSEAADFESYVGCAKLADLSQYLELFGFKEISRETFANHPNGGRYWDVVWERPEKMTLAKRLGHLIGLGAP
jgi:FkbM family methyltransferase